MTRVANALCLWPSLGLGTGTAEELARNDDLLVEVLCAPVMYEGIGELEELALAAMTRRLRT